jgi:Na+/melibiose symporter-like transporter
MVRLADLVAGVPRRCPPPIRTRPSLYRHRQFRRYFPALALSMCGDTALLIVLGIWVQSLTGSSAAAGAAFLLVILPSLGAPAVGYLIDRLPRRRLLIVSNVLSAAAVLPLLLVHSAHELWLIYAVCLGYGFSLAVIGNAQNGLYKAILPTGLLADATAAVQTSRAVMALAGPLAGAAVFASYGAAAVVIFDATTFLVAALVLGTVRVTEEAAQPRQRRLWVEMADGFQHIRRVRALRIMVGATFVAFLSVGFIESAAFALNTQGLGKPPSFLGVLLAVQAGGAIVGGLAAAWLVRSLGERISVGAGHLCLGLAAGLLATAQLPSVLVGMVLVGLAQPWMVVGHTTLLLRLSPPYLVGRVSTAASMLIAGPQVASIGVGAAAVAVVDYRLLLGCMLLTLIGTGSYLCLRSLSAEPGGDIPEDAGVGVKVMTP